MKLVVNVISLFFSDKSVPIDGYQGNANPIFISILLILCIIYFVYLSSVKSFFHWKMWFFAIVQFPTPEVGGLLGEPSAKPDLSKTSCYVVGLLAIAAILYTIVQHCVHHTCTCIVKLRFSFVLFFSLSLFLLYSHSEWILRCKAYTYGIFLRLLDKCLARNERFCISIFERTLVQTFPLSLRETPKFVQFWFDFSNTLCDSSVSHLCCKVDFYFEADFVFQCLKKKENKI